MDIMQNIFVFTKKRLSLWLVNALALLKLASSGTRFYCTINDDFYLTDVPFWNKYKPLFKHLRGSKARMWHRLCLHLVLEDILWDWITRGQLRHIRVLTCPWTCISTCDDGCVTAVSGVRTRYRLQKVCGQMCPRLPPPPHTAGVCWHSTLVRLL